MHDDGHVEGNDGEVKVAEAERVVDADAASIFELIADPAQQPRWDGNDNLGEAAADQRVRAVGDVFATTLTTGAVRHNRIVEFEEGRRIAWLPSEPDADPPGHLWRWELEPRDGGGTLVRHTYDWTNLRDPGRVERARSITPDRLRASVDRLAELAERG
ncbi:polyketide cyclase [Nitriliruptoraceae bacterium ZYF776]|nr:polyketide cyclase [Profundirhabdus halotolerans]